jgi:adenylate cyclase
MSTSESFGFRTRAFSNSAKARSRSTSTPLPLPDKPSVAVLSFTSIGSDARQERLADGITEDLITDLSRYRDLFVIASHTVFT